MLATDTTLEVRTCRATLLNSHLDKLSNAVLVKHLEGINVENLLLQVNGEEAGDVVAAVAESHLCEIVCTEAEIFGLLGDIVGCEGSTRNLNHGTDLELNLYAVLYEYFLRSSEDDSLLLPELLNGTDKRNHDFWTWVITFLLQKQIGTNFVVNA